MYTSRVMHYTTRESATLQTFFFCLRREQRGLWLFFVLSKSALLHTIGSATLAAQ